MNTNSSPFQYDLIGENTGFLLWQVSRVWQQLQEKALKKEIGLTQSQYVVLASTYWSNIHQSEVTQSYLVKHTKIDKMTVSKIIKTLINKDYICSIPHSVDTRANHISLTEQGEKIMEKAIKIIELIDTDFFSRVSNLPSFNTSLEEIIDNKQPPPQKQ